MFSQLDSLFELQDPIHFKEILEREQVEQEYSERPYISRLFVIVARFDLGSGKVTFGLAFKISQDCVATEPESRKTAQLQ